MTHPTRWILLCAGVALLGACPPPETAGAQCQSYLPGDVVITEFLPDPNGTDSGQEFVELYNASGSELDLLGMTLSVSADDGSGEKQHRFRSVKIAAGAYLAAGDSTADPLPAWLGYSYGNDFGRGMRNTGGKITLRCGDKIIDLVTYTAPKSGKSVQLSGQFVPDSAVNDSSTNFCDGSESYDGMNLGTPGKANTACATTGGGTTCIDAITGEERPVVSPAVGDLVITELMANPDKVDDAKGEWFEVAALSDIDLNGLKIQSGSSSSTLSAGTCIRVSAGTFAVLARSDDPMVNGGLPAVTAVFNANLVNMNGSLSLYLGEQLIDQVTWVNTTAGASLQLDATKIDPIANDDAANLCTSDKTYGDGDRGTPGEENGTCAPVQTGDTCFDQGLGMDRLIVRPAVGDLVITEFMADPASPVTDTDGEWFEVMAKADVDLNQLLLGNEGTTTTAVKNTNCVRLSAGSHALFVRTSDPTKNGGLDPLQTFSFNLANSGDRAIVLRSVDVEIDRVTWTAALPGVSTQLSANALDATSNDDPANFCGGTAEYSPGNRGTPGTANDLCP